MFKHVPLNRFYLQIIGKSGIGLRRVTNRYGFLDAYRKSNCISVFKHDAARIAEENRVMSLHVKYSVSYERREFPGLRYLGKHILNILHSTKHGSKCELIRAFMSYYICLVLVRSAVIQGLAHVNRSEGYVVQLPYNGPSEQLVGDLVVNHLFEDGSRNAQQYFGYA